MDELARPARHRPARVPPPQRAPRRRHDRDRPGARGERRPGAVPRGAAAALAKRLRADVAAFNARARTQQTCAAASASAACGTASATRRSPIPRRCASGCAARRPADRSTTARSTSARARTRSCADRRRRARPAGGAVRPGDGRHRPARPTPARPRPRARPSSPARPPSSPARDLRAHDPAAGQCRPDAALARLDGAALDRGSGTARSGSTSRARPADADGVVAARARATSIRRPRRSTPTARACPTPTYGFAAQIAEVEVDLELGTVKVLRIVAAHDVGRAINPTLVEGQIHGGIAQGLGMALMEEYLPGRTENLHDYLIPTVGDVPRIECILIEDPRAARAVRRQGRRRAGPGPDRAGDPRRDPPRDRRAHAPRCRSLPHRLRAAHPRAEKQAMSDELALAPGRTRRRHRPLRRLPGAVPDPRRAAPAPATATPTSTASWCASIRWSLTGQAPIDARSPFARAAGETGTASWCAGPRRFVTGIGAGTTYPDYKPAPFIVSSQARRRRHGHGRDRGHLQLLQLQGEDRHRPLPRPRAGGRARRRASRSATSPRPSTARRCCRSAACTT